MQTSDCEANASLSSTRSRSSTPSPARSRALRVAGTGPMPITAGSTPGDRGRRRPAPSAAARARAPGRLDEQHRGGAVVDPGAVARRDGAALALEGRPKLAECLDRACRPAGARHGRRAHLALPSADLDRDDLVGEPACVDRRDGASMALQREGVLALARDAPALGDVLGGLAHRVAGSSVSASLGLMNRQPSVVSWSSRGPRSQASSGLAMTYGARVIDSTPPATKTSPSPTAIAWAAALIACRPEPHRRLTVRPPTSTGKPASSAAIRADVAVVLARLIGAAEDDVLDDRGVDAGTVDDRAQRRAPRGHRGGREASAPPYRPIGVRTASTIHASRTGRSGSRVIAADRSGSATRGRLAGLGELQIVARKRSGCAAPSLSAVTTSSCAATPSSIAMCASSAMAISIRSWISIRAQLP